MLGRITWRRSPDLKVQRLSGLPLFRECSRGELGVVARMVDVISIEAGSILVRHGDAPRQALVILEGLAGLSADDQTVALLGEPDILGAISAFSGRRHRATVTALTPMEVVVIGARELVHLARRIPTLAQALLGVGSGTEVSSARYGT
jgi:CRP-like cAMP-binding protein